MKPLALTAAVSLLALLAAPRALAQAQHDPLTERETDELREVAPEPVPKIKLYVQFARARMDAIEKARADASLSHKERGEKVHAALEDLEAIVDELGDNLESFAKHDSDMRKPLREVISMDGDFRARLGTLKQQASDPALADEYKEYQFILDDALDSVKSNDDLAHDLLEEQNQAAERKKHQKK